MAEMVDESTSLESTTVGIFRTAATVKGGRRFSFGALVVLGDRHGTVGIGYGKANQVPMAIEKAQKDAKKHLSQYELQGKTITHQIEGRFGACRARLVPASPGTGVIAGAGIKQGYVHGESDKTGSAPLEDPIHPRELLATIYHGFGIDPESIVYNHLNQPRELVKAQAVTELFT